MKFFSFFKVNALADVSGSLFVRSLTVCSLSLVWLDWLFLNIYITTTNIITGTKYDDVDNVIRPTAFELEKKLRRRPEDLVYSVTVY